MGRPGRIALCALTIAFALCGVARADSSSRACGQALLKMRDGVRLHGWVNREEPVAPRPVLLTITSYANSGCPGPSSYYVAPAVANRMTMVFVSMRGTGASEGRFDLFGPDTARDIDAVLDWAASQPWSNGRIVLAGSSGNGLFMIDGLRHPAVVAGVAETACADLYRCFHRGGANAQQVAGVYFANMAQGYEAGAQLRLQDGTAANPTPAQQLAAFPQVEAQALSHPTHDAYWNQRSLLDALPQLHKPVMFTSSDFDLLDPVDQWWSARDAWINLGLSHSIWADYANLGNAPPAYRDIVLGQLNAFVARFGLQDGPAPPRVALMTADGSYGAWEQQDAFLRTEDAYPLPSTRWTDLFLAPRTLNRVPPAPRSQTLPLVSSPGIGQDLRLPALAPALVRADAGYETAPVTGAFWDLRREEPAGWTFTTPPLRRNLEVTGPILADLWARTAASDFTWAVRLTDVAPDGASQWITDGYLRASLRRYDDRRSERDGARLVRTYRRYDRSEPVPLLKPTEYMVQLQDASNVFRAGHRLRLDILPLAGAGYDTASAPGAGALTLLEHPSRLQLPVIPSRCQLSAPMLPSARPPAACAPSYAAAVTG